MQTQEIEYLQEFYDEDIDDRGDPVAFLEWNNNSYPLFHGDNIIGRCEKCDVSITDSTVSDRHAEISFENKLFRLKDLRSSNGTFVENKEVEKKYNKLKRNMTTILEDGMLIKFGNSVCTFFLSIPGRRSIYYDKAKSAIVENDTATFCPNSKVSVHNTVLPAGKHEHNGNLIKYFKKILRFLIKYLN